MNSASKKERRQKVKEAIRIASGIKTVWGKDELLKFVNDIISPIGRDKSGGKMVGRHRFASIRNLSMIERSMLKPSPGKYTIRPDRRRKCGQDRLKSPHQFSRVAEITLKNGAYELPTPSVWLEPDVEIT